MFYVTVLLFSSVLVLWIADYCNLSHISYRTTEWPLPCPVSLRLIMVIYAVNPGYPRDLKSSTASATTSFRAVTCVNPSSSSALVDSKLMLNGTSFVKPGSPRGTFGIPSSIATLTYFVHHDHQYRIRRLECYETYEGLGNRRRLSSG
jgi:hypothetical protein